MMECGFCGKKIEKPYVWVDDGQEPVYPICKSCFEEYANDFDEIL